MTKDLSPPATPPARSPIPSHRSNLLHEKQPSITIKSAKDYKDELLVLKDSFHSLTPLQKQYFLADIIDSCDTSQLAFLNTIIAPRLKVDFIKELPSEIALYILSFIDTPNTLARASYVSKYWNNLIKDDTLWRTLSQSYQYIDTNAMEEDLCYRDHFKRMYSIGRAWKRGGHVTTVDSSFSPGLVTSLQFDEKFIVVGSDNHRIEVFDTNSGAKIRTLEGHEGGVWALQFKGGEQHDRERILVSGGCDRDVRVWDLNNGKLKYLLRGHTSTVRCLKIRDKRIAVTGSRDTTLRVWDIKRGLLLHVLSGHLASVRCLDIHGDIVVSGSYDSQARIWDIKTGQCKHVLVGHVSQIYAIVTNGTIVATGSLDSHIRIWSVETGECLATLYGHTSLVGQIQLLGNTLVSGGADGCLRVWDMETFECIQQFSAHDNSITCLQFDKDRILSAANDGKVKLWDIHEGRLIRNITSPSKIVWKVQFSDTKAVILMQRPRADDADDGRTVMEIHNFDSIAHSA